MKQLNLRKKNMLKQDPREEKATIERRPFQISQPQPSSSAHLPSSFRWMDWLFKVNRALWTPGPMQDTMDNNYMYEFPKEITWEEIFIECAQRIG